MEKTRFRKWIVSRDDPDFMNGVPSVLYKYRDNNNAYHRRLLTDRELYFASPNTFNDPFDCALPFRWDPADLTEENIFMKYLDSLRKDRPDLTELQRHELAFNEQREGHFHNDDRIVKISDMFIEKIHKQTGIVSLTSEKDNILMWSHYANCHTGFAMGFDKFALYDSTCAAFLDVIYQPDIPTFGLFEDYDQRSYKLLATKSNHWEYEQERRLLSNSIINKPIKLPTEAVKEIVLGWKMPQKDKDQIIELAGNIYPDAKVYDAHSSKREFKMEFLQIR